MREGDLAGLTQLTAMAFDASQARLSALARREAGIRAAIAALDMARRTRDAQALAPDPALRAGADPLWHGWLDDRRASHNLDLARLLAGIEIARGEARLAFGRNLAAKGLQDDVRRAAANARQRREDSSF